VNALPALPIPPGIEDTRILVLRENWLGSTGLAAFEAFRRMGAWVSGISEGDYIPLRWSSFPMRAAGRALRSSAVRELNEAIL
jgi:hypothetical protein